MAFILEPKKIPLLLRLGIFVAEKKTKKTMEPARVLSWYPKAAIGSGVLESLVAHEDEGISKRFLQLIRMQVSIMVNCSFCIDMNGNEFELQGITIPEVEALKGNLEFDDVSTFSKKEIIALRYVVSLTKTPVEENADLVDQIKKTFNERQFVIIVTTIAQVNYWARLIKGFGIPPAGFRTDCDI